MLRISAASFAIGACVLVLETLGSLLLAPRFGTSATTWSALIVVTMAALAAGAVAGGKLADRGNEAKGLSLLLRSAALWVIVVPQARGPLLSFFALFGLKAGALGAAAALLFAPLAALGGATPLLVRLGAREGEPAGRVYGFVSAAATLGGVAGALAAGFALLPHLSLFWVLAGVAAVLTATGSLLRIPERTGAR